MQAKDIMTPVVECVSPDISLEEAARKMKTMDIGFLPVCENDRLAGTITDRDIVLRAIAEGKDVKQLKAQDVMTPAAFWCFEDHKLNEVSDYMAKRGIRRVLVLNRDKRLTGVISIGDLAKRSDRSKAGETLSSIAEAPSAKAA